MSVLVIRGRTLTFKRAPTSIHDKDSYNYNEDGALLIKDGLISDFGNYHNHVMYLIWILQ